MGKPIYLETREALEILQKAYLLRKIITLDCRSYHRKAEKTQVREQADKTSGEAQRPVKGVRSRPITYGVLWP